MFMSEKRYRKHNNIYLHMTMIRACIRTRFTAYAMTLYVMQQRSELQYMKLRFQCKTYTLKLIVSAETLS